jgi:hypothetical protein
LKPGFLALLQDPFDPKLLDIVIFDVSPCTDRNGEGQTTLANEIKEHTPLHFGFEVFLFYLRIVWSSSLTYHSNQTNNIASATPDPTCLHKKC